MTKLTVNTATCLGPIKPEHCVNNGPVVARADQVSGNFLSYKAARIPYARNHDASHCSSYGGCHTVDVSCIFRDFDADPDDPANYDFVLTDDYIQKTLNAGTKTYYRLGASIEHWIKKYNTLPPKDFKKWAVICEHIIRHMNEGWADGHHFDIEYWEIWNEPDLVPETSSYYDKKTWGGMDADFYEFYDTVACYLGEKFKNIKIGGCAFARGHGKFIEEFLAYITRDGHRAPLDFISWHTYDCTPEGIVADAESLRALVDSYGYTEAESILNEWNYIIDWDVHYVESLLAINGLKGAAFTAATMILSQNLPIDMLMYYDARPGGFCGLYDFVYRLQKGYYPFPIFADLYELGTQVETASDDPEIKFLAAKDADGKFAAMGAYFTNDPDALYKLITVTGVPEGAKLYVVDEQHDLEPYEVICENGQMTFSLAPNGVFEIK